MPKPLLPLTVAAALFCAGTALAGSFTSSFSSSSQTGFTLTGVAPWTPVIESGHVVLTRNSGSQQGSIILDQLDVDDFGQAQPIDSFVASFKLQIGPASSPPADGVAFAFGPEVVSSSNFGEDGLGSGVIVSFDTYDNGGGEAPMVDVRYGGAVLFQQAYTAAQIVDSKFGDVRIEVTRSGLISLGYKGQILCTNLIIPNYAPMAGQFGIGARTGGSSEAAYVDDLNVTTVASLGYVAPVILAQPQSQTVAEGAGVTFAVAYDGSAPITFQWYRDGSPVTDATGPVLSLARVAYADDGSVFTCLVINSSTLDQAESDPATLTVLRDLVKPTLVSAEASLDFTRVTVTFSKPVSQATAEEAGNYQINGLGVLTAAQGTPNGTRVVLTTDPQAEGGQYTLTVNNVEDLATIPNPIAPNSKLSFQAYAYSPGFLQFWTYDTPEATTDNTVAGLTASANYPFNPMAQFQLSIFDSRRAYPDDTHEHYGARFLGSFVPPKSGDWLFYLKSDDESELWLNPIGTDPAGAQLIISANYCCLGFADSPSDPIPLLAGQRCFIMGLYKEGTGGDYMQVAAKLATDPTDPNMLPPIPGSWLGCDADPNGAKLTIKQQPTNQLSTAKITVGLQDFKTDNGFFSVLSSGSPGKPWLFNSSTKTWMASDRAGCGVLYKFSALSTPAYQVVTPGPLTLSVVHRHSFQATNSVENYDGGQIWLSVNGAPYQAVTSPQFTAKGYNGVVGSGGLNPTCIFRDQEAFVGKSTSFDAGTYITSTANLGDFKTGDTISLQFLAAWDGCDENTEPNWQVKTLQFSPAVERSAAQVTFSVQVDASLPGKTNPPVAYQWQIDRGAGFVDIANAIVASYKFVPSLTDHGAKVRCLVYMPGSAGVTSDAAMVLLQALTPVSLAITRSGANVVISWPADAAGYAPEETAQLPPGADWKTAVGTLNVNGNTKTLTAPATGPQKFYRLRK